MPVAVYGATGHTGRFVLAELARRSLGELFDARDFLAALDTIAVSFGTTADPVFTRRDEYEQQ